LHDAFVKAILEIAGKPEKFDSSRETTIEDFLAGASQRALLQILRAHRRRKKREEKKARTVADEASPGRPVADTVADSELVDQARAIAKTDDERNVLRLWELGHADAEIAEQSGLPAAEVKRLRDRLTQRLRRLRKPFDNQES
jgi:DNA-directed RNA polymerase specialized sigma24 family protein